MSADQFLSRSADRLTHGAVVVVAFALVFTVVMVGVVTGAAGAKGEEPSALVPVAVTVPVDMYTAMADIAAALIRQGVEVWISNHRSVEGILDYILRLGALVGAAGKARSYSDGLRADLEALALQASRHAARPKVYFEEWDEPLISGIQWVAELIRIAGGDDILPELAAEPLAKNRIMADGSTVIARDPDIIFGSWCGKKFRPDKVAIRPGWQNIAAVRNRQLFEIKSPTILQPGPAALTDGVHAMAQHIRDWHQA